MSMKLMTGVIAAGLLLGSVTGCRTTHQVSESPKDFSGFLGDYSMLEKGTGGEANYVYFDHTADWSKYTKVYIENIDLWKSNDPDSPLGKLSKDDQQMLVNFYHTALANALEEVLGSEVAATYRGGPWGFGDAPALARLANEGGFTDVDVHKYELPVVFEGGPHQLQLTLGAASVATIVAQLSEADQSALSAAVEHASRSITKDGVIRSHAASHILTAVKDR